MAKKLFASVMTIAMCLSMLATDMIVKQRNGEEWKINVADVEEVFFKENGIQDDSSVIDASETLLRFDISSDSTAEVTGLKIGGVDELIIPAKVRIDGKVYTVTSIKDFAFDTNYLGSVMIPSSITKLYGLQISTNFTVSKDNPAFSSLDGVLYDKEKTKVIKAPEKLKGDLVIPESVISIGKGAFYGCRSLASIDIPESVTSIGESAFYYCESLTSINIPENVTSIGKSAFYYCERLTSINIPEGVTSIGDGAFKGCRSLTNINIPEGVTSIGELAFWECSSLTSINIPEGVTSIGKLAFWECYSLTNINIPESLTSIGDGAFELCKSLTNVNIPESLTSIGDGAFELCKSLESIDIPESVTSIGRYAFRNCTNLNVVIDNSEGNVNIGEDAFENCKSVTWLKD